MILRSQLGKIRRSLLCFLHRRLVPLGNAGPIVSFTFDDFPRTALSTAGRILEDFGARGTYYVTMGLMGVNNELGEMFHRDDLYSALDAGHELGTQTFHHSSCRALALVDFCRDVHQGGHAIEKVVGHNSASFAYPYGHVTLQAKRLLGPALSSSRSIFPGFNGPEIDLNLLRANRLYGDVDGLSQVERLVRENAERRSWIIFYTHDVRRNPSEYGCTPELFHSAAALAAESGARIMTVGEVLAQVGMPHRTLEGQGNLALSL